MHQTETGVSTNGEARNMSGVGYAQDVVRDVVGTGRTTTGLEGHWIGVRDRGRL